MSEDILSRIDEIREMSGGESEHLTMLQVSEWNHSLPLPDHITRMYVTEYPHTMFGPNQSFFIALATNDPLFFQPSHC